MTKDDRPYLTDEKLAEYARQGLTSREISEKTGFRMDSIRRRANKAKIDLRIATSSQRKFTDEALIALVEEGLHQKVIAQRLGVSQSTVNKSIFRLGLRKRLVARLREKEPPKERPPLYHLTKEQKRDVRTLMRRGSFSQQEAIEIVTRPKVKISAKVRPAPRELRP